MQSENIIMRTKVNLPLASLPVAVETLGSLDDEASVFQHQLGHRIMFVTGERLVLGTCYSAWTLCTTYRLCNVY